MGIHVNVENQIPAPGLRPILRGRAQSLAASGEDDNDLMQWLDDNEDKAAGLPTQAVAPWQILIVDDEPQVHDATVVALRRTHFHDRPCTFLHAYSAAEALQLISETTTIDLMLLDVVMETHDAGLRLVRKLRDGDIRPDLKIVIRSGQPGWERATMVSRDYPIDGYLPKAEQTYERMVETIGPILGNTDGPDTDWQP